jgi:prolyl 4-hydroxylase
MPMYDPFKSLDNIMFPNANKVDTDKVNMYTIDNYLDDDVCDKLIELIRQNNTPSTITTAATETDQKFRTSKSAFFYDDKTGIVDDVNNQISRYMGIEPERSESIQGQFYEVGDEFKYHTDYFEYTTPCWKTHGKDLGQRTWTFMVYLNKVEEGGSTHFKNIDKHFYPKKGMAVIWNNLYATGACNPDTLHCGSPIIKGEKFIITKWFRDRGTLKTFHKSPIPNKIPNFTQLGFKLATLSPSLFKKLLEEYTTNQESAIKENVDDIYYGSKTNTDITDLVQVSDVMKQELNTEIKTMLETWVGMELKLSAIYGIRVYKDNSILKLHTDTYTTHIISVIINISQSVRKEWPLILYDNYGKEHKIYIKPGQVCMYESAKCWHGRPIPFEGDEFANIFLHYKPATWDKYAERLVKRVESHELLPPSPIDYKIID